MLNSLCIGNFKAFAETQHIPIRPLTLIFGANSSGKSSIIHSLLFARHASETGELDTYQTSVGGETVDLGGFRQYIHQRETDREFEWGIEIDADRIQREGFIATLIPRVNRISISLTVGGIKPAVKRYELSVDDESLIRLNRRDDGSMGLSWLEFDHAVMKRLYQIIIQRFTVTSVVTSDFYEKLNRIIEDLLPWINIQMGDFLPIGFPVSEQDFETLLQTLPKTSQNPDTYLERISSLINAQRFDLAAPILTSLLRPLNDFIRNTNDAVINVLNRVSYLGPLRSYPPRTISFVQHQDPNISAGGGYVWEVLRRDEMVRTQINEWLGNPNRFKTPYEFTVQSLVNMEELEKPLLRSLSALDQEGLRVEVDYDPYAEEGQKIRYVPQIADPINEVERIKQYIAEIDRFKELLLVDKRTNTIVSHRDIGIGISQVLPVLVGAYASKDRVIAIEQPEIHLHPALQAELGDVFIESALGGRQNTFLLETHSEHLILRIMRRMRNTAEGKLPAGLPEVKPDHVAILYVQPVDNPPGTIALQLDLDEKGRLLDPWPGGFFEEGFIERFAEEV